MTGLNGRLSSVECIIDTTSLFCKKRNRDDTQKTRTCKNNEVERGRERESGRKMLNEVDLRRTLSIYHLESENEQID